MKLDWRNYPQATDAPDFELALKIDEKIKAGWRPKDSKGLTEANWTVVEGKLCWKDGDTERSIVL